MRRRLALLLLVPLAAACGSGETVGGGPSSTVVGEEPTVSTVEPNDPSHERPPPVTLVSDAGTQIAVQGGFCVTGPDFGVCTDSMAPEPEELSVVRPGETVEIVVEGAQAAGGSGSVRVLWCDTEIASVTLDGPSTSWVVDLEAGSYELEFLATFEAGELSGDTAGVFGLLVDPTAPLEVMLTPDSIAGCTTD